jgi:hypothetical protein
LASISQRASEPFRSPLTDAAGVAFGSAMVAVLRNEDCSPRPTQINIVSTAAMHTPLLLWVKPGLQGLSAPSLLGIPLSAPKQADFMHRNTRQVLLDHIVG